MTKELRLLRKFDRVVRDLQFPGYPYQTNVIIDLNHKRQFVEGKEVKDWLQVIAPEILYEAVTSRKCVKQSFVFDSSMPTPQELLHAKNDEFEVDNADAIKFYLALSSMLRQEKSGYIWAVYDKDCEWVDCQHFDTYEEIKKYYDEHIATAL